MDTSALETRAGDLLDRLTDCGLGDGLTEEDLYGGGVREPLRTCCVRLAGRLWALHQDLDAVDLRLLQGAVNDLRQAASSEQAAAAGRLNACLARLAHTLDPTFTPPPAGPAGSSAAAGSSARLEVLELLTGVVQGAAMLAAVQRAQQPQQQPAQQQQQQQQAAAAEPPSEEMEDPVAVELSRTLRGLADLLEVPRPLAGWESAAALVDALGAALHSVVAQLPPGFFDPLLPPGALSQEQLATLSEVNAALHDEYALRRRMLIERVGVTLKSFLWSNRLGETGTKEAAQAAVDAAAQQMSAEPSVAIDDVFRTTAGDLLTVMERATSGESGVEASVKGVLIGSVPDRGGRPEGRARVADMPAWTARRVTERGGRGGRRGGGGGRVQGGWQGGGRGGHQGGGAGGGGGKGGQWGGRGGRGGAGGGQFEFQGAAKRGRSGH